VMNPADVSFAKIAIEQKVATSAQIEEALDLQRKMEVLGVFTKSIAEILMERGILSQALVRAVYRIQGQREGFPGIAGLEFEAKIGHGGMGTVYRARQVALDRTVAVKILAPDLARDRTFVSRFLMEARAVAALNHENIIVGIDVGRTPSGDYYFVMEYVEGETVYEILTREDHLEEKRALRIALQMAHALKHAADHNLVHRDVKPDNIMITRDGVAKLCDLGLAKSTRARLRLTHAGSTHGTPHYMSPEQARGREDIDIRSDIYSLGATLYHMLVGEVPFDGESAAVILLKHISEDLPSPRIRRPEVSENACHVLERMMAKRPEDRFQTPQEIIDDLECVLAGEAPKSSRPAPGQSSILRIPTEPGAIPAVPEIFRDEPTEPMARSDLTGAGYLQPLVVLTAGVLLLLLAAGVAGGVLQKPGRSPEGPPPPRTGPSPSPPQPVFNPTVEEEKWAADHLQDALNRAAAHPGDRRGPLAQFLSNLQRFPGTRGAFRAEEEIMRILAAEDREVDRLLETLEPAVRGRLDAGRPAEARKLAAEAAARFAPLEELGVADRVQGLERLKTLRGRIEEKARARGEALAAETDRLEAAGDLAGALRALEEAAGLGLPEWEARVRPRIASLTERAAREEEERCLRAEAEGCRRYLAFLSEVAASLGNRRYDDASARMRDAAADPGLEKFRDRLPPLEGVAADGRVVWKTAMDGLSNLAAVGSETLLRLRDGTEVGGYPEVPGPDGRFRVFFDPERKGAKASLRVDDLAASEVLDLADLRMGKALERSELVRRGAFLLSEGDLEGARTDLARAEQKQKGTDVKGLLMAAGDLRDAAAEAAASRGLEEAGQALARSEWDKARGILLGFSGEWKGTMVRVLERLRIDKALAQSEEALVRKETIESVLFGKVEKAAGGAHRIVYEFETLAPLMDWRILRGEAGTGNWTLLPGGEILGNAGAGLRWVGRFAGAMEVEAEIVVREEGGFAEFLRLEGAEGDYAIRLGLGEAPHQIFRIARKPGAPDVWTLLDKRPAESLKKGSAARVAVRASPDRIVLLSDDEVLLDVPEGPAGTGTLSLWANPVRLSFRKIRIECRLDPVWLLGH